MASSIDPSVPRLKPVYIPAASATSDQATEEHGATAALVRSLNLLPHIEGGYFAEIDRNPLTMPNPFLGQDDGEGDKDQRTAAQPFSGDDSVRNASTTIYYFLSANRPVGCFHRNRARTVHTLIWGRGRYVLIHADEAGRQKRIETFVVGWDVEKGERPVWIVEGGKYKASFLLEGDVGGKDGLLISETVVPGFEYSDHDFLPKDKFKELVNEAQAEELGWLVREV